MQSQLYSVAEHRAVNADWIGLTWDCVRLDESELLIRKTLMRDSTATHKRLWSGTKTGKALVVTCRPAGREGAE